MSVAAILNLNEIRIISVRSFGLLLFGLPLLLLLLLSPLPLVAVALCVLFAGAKRLEGEKGEGAPAEMGCGNGQCTRGWRFLVAR